MDLKQRFASSPDLGITVMNASYVQILVTLFEYVYENGKVTVIPTLIRTLVAFCEVKGGSEAILSELKRLVKIRKGEKGITKTNSETLGENSTPVRILNSSPETRYLVSIISTIRFPIEGFEVIYIFNRIYILGNN